MNKTYYYLLIMGILSILLAACYASNEIHSVTPDEFEKGLSSEGVQLLDVRTADEYSEGHLATAINIDVTSPDFLQQASSTLSKEDKVYLYCRSGKRSLKAAQLLTKEGYQVVNLKTGILGWISAGKPVTK